MLPVLRPVCHASRPFSAALLLALCSSAALAQTDEDPESAAARVAAEAAVEIDPWTGEHMDALAEAIGDARVVMLGEAWHGDGGAIALRARLVAFLHERLGFDVLAFEADFYGLHENWAEARRSGDVSAVQADVWPFWAETRAAAPLWHYVRERMARGDTLHVAGIDPQAHGRTSRERLPTALRQRLLGLPGVQADSVDAAVAFFDAALNRDLNAIEDDAARAALLDRLLRRLSAETDGTPEARFWARIAEGQTGGSRDRAMGENLVWLATEQYPGRKIIVWAHNNHVLTDKWVYFESPDAIERYREAPAAHVGRPTYLGDVARAFFGRRLYAIATVPYAGTYSPDIGRALRGETADFDATVTLVPAPTGTLEAALAETGYEIAFADLRPLACEVGLLRSRVLDYAFLEPLALRVADGWDGLLFVRQTFGLNEAPPDGWGLP